ncbi:hypothetical protein [Leptospira meyeri]|uniref:hypothetical protein n=1 Tax=Leptospira meyeri TaxID=29508 RepID=UPI0012DBD0A7|nr:hypothetical protein [Leptospira meyeri]
MKLYPGGIRKYYTIKLTDKYGTEELQSIKEFKLKLLSDSINQIVFEIFDPRNDTNIQVLFDKEEGTSLYLDLELEDARGFAVQFIDKLIRLLSNYKSFNRLFHLPDYLNIAIFFYGLYKFINLISMFSEKNYKEFLASSLILLSIISYYFVGYQLRTIVSFETKKYQQFNKHFSWFVAGNISFLIFGILYPIVIEFIVN